MSAVAAFGDRHDDERYRCCLSRLRAHHGPTSSGRAIIDVRVAAN